jgi:2-polyprenyl-3-methyl-5-hydroxy-6-metoxy-1,4-benzoquinol methylase
MKDGGYDIGYKKCNCFWGTKPGSLILKLESYIDNFNSLKVLDLGCGEGKNSIYLANKGAIVDAYDISEYAINNAQQICKDHPNIKLQTANVIDLNFSEKYYDIIISYGLFHCFHDKKEVSSIIKSSLKALKSNGFFILCAFNSREQDLSAHKDFNPLLLSHDEYLGCFSNDDILFQSDENLYETHPHNQIPHMHSMTRIIIKKS